MNVDILLSHWLAWDMKHNDVSPSTHQDSQPSSGSASIADLIRDGATHLGIELGSTRIKAALISSDGAIIATGSHTWENEYADDNWTYSLDSVWAGIQDCYAALAQNVRTEYQEDLTSIASIGISAMMHGYLAFDASGELLAPFRTWRNTYTSEAAATLSEAFSFNVPLRWSISHLLHAIMQGEEHVTSIDFMTTLAGYVHWKLSGERVLGVGDASGVFPIAADGRSYDPTMLKSFADLEAVREMPWSLPDVLPAIRQAGESAGTLTAEGAALLDPSGALQPGALMAPPEGDAGTGMVATNAVRPRTGNVSAGTSAFAMVVLEKPLSGPRPEIDMVTTPSGDHVAMIHTNNCTSDLNSWVQLFREFAAATGTSLDDTELFATLFGAASSGDSDAGGILTYNYTSGEHQTGIESGRPLLVREQSARFTLPNFMKAQLYGAFGALAVGMEALLVDEGVGLDVMYAHGGIFGTAGVAQQVLADALNTPVSIGDSAAEGGAWGMALLAAFASASAGAAAEADNAAPSTPASLADFLEQRIFDGFAQTTLAPSAEGTQGHRTWIAAYKAGLPIESLAGELLN